MNLKELTAYVECGHEIEFLFDGKQYSITYWYPDNDENNRWISFCEFYKETTEVKTVEELWNNVSRDGVTVGDMLSSIGNENIDIY